MEQSHAIYIRRLRRHEAAQRRHRLRYDRISTVRSVAFVLGGIALIAGVTEGSAAYTAAAAVMAAVFVWGVWVHRGITEAIARTEGLAEINREAIRRVEGRWGEFPERGEEFSDEALPLLAELNVLGPNSLFQMVQHCATSRGRAALAGWLRGHCDPAAIEARQSAVRELAPRLTFRQRLLMEGRRRGVPLEPDGFLEWMRSPSYLTGRRGLMILQRTLVSATIGLMLAQVLAGLPPFWIAGLLIQTAVYIVTGERCRSHYLPALARDAQFLSYAAMFEWIEKQKFSGSVLRSVQSQLVTGSVRLSSRLREFEKVNGALCLHYSILYPFINVLLLWDIHYLHRLERWKEAMREGLESAFGVLAEIEALSSLAGLAHDRPDFSYPRITADAPPFRAVEMGHPLIAPAERVSNTFEIASEGGLALVTGSNMSGKSTFVRTVGINMVLAFSGAPVAAKELAARPCALLTCIQPQDSIALHVSHFYSEVRAIKRVLEAATAGRIPVLYLIDEIFSGTNTKERLIASRGLMLRLAESGSWGIVTTHDLELVTLSDRNPRVRNYHFRDELAPDGRMVFPYRIHEGAIQTTNALKLLKREGIEFEE